MSALDNVFRTPLHWAAVLGETWFHLHYIVCTLHHITGIGASCGVCFAFLNIFAF